MIGAYPLRVRPSKTAIVPVNRAYLPRNDTERALCSRTVYAANIDKKIDAPQIKQFFQSLCGEAAAWCCTSRDSLTDIHMQSCIKLKHAHDVMDMRRGCVKAALIGRCPSHHKNCICRVL